MLFFVNYYKISAMIHTTIRKIGYFCDNLINIYSIMKKIILMTLMFVCGIMLAAAQTANGGKQAEIKFDKTTHNFGKFSESAPKVSCTFTFTNVGDAPLIINQAVASCGCTATEYTKTPVKPGEKGELKITYNGEGKFPGHFKKSITVRTNGKVEMTRLYVEGDMEEVKK